MIRAEQVPQSVKDAFYNAYWREEATDEEAIAAAINSWPGVIHNGHWLLFPHTKLPLTENINVKG